MIHSKIVLFFIKTHSQFNIMQAQNEDILKRPIKDSVAIFDLGPCDSDSFDDQGSEYERQDCGIR